MSGLGQRLSQLRQAYVQTRELDPALTKMMALAAAVGVAVPLVLGFVLGAPVWGAAFAVVLGLLAALFVFGQRTSKAAIGQIEGRPGAAAAVLTSLRGWKVTPAVAFSRKQDFVHRAVGKAGVVLVGEGAPARVSALLKQERRRMARIVGETPVHEIAVGDGPDQIPLGRLQAELTRLPRVLKAPAVATLDQKLAALPTGDLPIPKGPIPRAPRR